MATALTPAVFLPGEHILIAGAASRAIYFVHSGRVLISTRRRASASSRSSWRRSTPSIPRLALAESGLISKPLDSGQRSGSGRRSASGRRSSTARVESAPARSSTEETAEVRDSYFGEAGLFPIRPDYASVRAITHVDTYVLTRVSFEAALRNYPSSAAFMADAVHELFADAETADRVRRALHDAAGLSSLRLYQRMRAWRPRRGLAAKIRAFGLLVASTPEFSAIGEAARAQKAAASRFGSGLTRALDDRRRKSDASVATELAAISDRQCALEVSHARSARDLQRRFDVLAAQMSALLGGEHAPKPAMGTEAPIEAADEQVPEKAPFFRVKPGAAETAKTPAKPPVAAPAASSSWHMHPLFTGSPSKSAAADRPPPAAVDRSTDPRPADTPSAPLARRSAASMRSLFRERSGRERSGAQTARQHAAATAVQAVVRGLRARSQLLEKLEAATASVNESIHQPAGLRTPVSRPSKSAWHAPLRSASTDPNAHLYYA